MTTISSALGKADDGATLIQRGALQQLAGVEKRLTRAEFDTAVTAERTRIANNSTGIYPAGERIAIFGEAGARVWVVGSGGTDPQNAASSHARTVDFGQGNSLVLAADSNVATVGLPTSGIGSANGDAGVVWGQGVFVRAGGQWVIALTFGAAPFSGISYDSYGRLSGYLLNGLTHTVTYPDATHIVDVAGSATTTYTLDSTGRFISKAVA